MMSAQPSQNTICHTSEHTDLYRTATFFNPSHHHAFPSTATATTTSHHGSHISLSSSHVPSSSTMSQFTKANQLQQQHPMTASGILSSSFHQPLPISAQLVHRIAIKPLHINNDSSQPASGITTTTTTAANSISSHSQKRKPMLAFQLSNPKSQPNHQQYHLYSRIREKQQQHPSNSTQQPTAALPPSTSISPDEEFWTKVNHIIADDITKQPASSKQHYVSLPLINSDPKQFSSKKLRQAFKPLTSPTSSSTTATTTSMLPGAGAAESTCSTRDSLRNNFSNLITLLDSPEDDRRVNRLLASPSSLMQFQHVLPNSFNTSTATASFKHNFSQPDAAYSQQNPLSPAQKQQQLYLRKISKIFDKQSAPITDSPDHNLSSLNQSESASSLMKNAHSISLRSHYGISRNHMQRDRSLQDFQQKQTLGSSRRILFSNESDVTSDHSHTKSSRNTAKLRFSDAAGLSKPIRLTSKNVVAKVDSLLNYADSLRASVASQNENDDLLMLKCNEELRDDISFNASTEGNENYISSSGFEDNIISGLESSRTIVLPDKLITKKSKLSCETQQSQELIAGQKQSKDVTYCYSNKAMGTFALPLTLMNQEHQFVRGQKAILRSKQQDNLVRKLFHNNTLEDKKQLNSKSFQ